MTPLALAVLGASLLGSLHCAGMCGGFVAFCSAGDAARRRPGLAVHVVHGAGRLVAYVVLGVAAGALGAALDVAGALAGIHRAAAVLAGALVVVWGSAALLAALGVRLPSIRGVAFPVGWGEAPLPGSDPPGAPSSRPAPSSPPWPVP